MDRSGPPVERLTPTERDLLQAFSNGWTSKDVAERSGMALNTVRVHRSNILTKLHVATITEAVAIAFRAGMVA